MKKLRSSYTRQVVLGTLCDAAYWAAFLFLLWVAGPLPGQSANAPEKEPETPQAFEVGPANVVSSLAARRPTVFSGISFSAIGTSNW